MKHTLLLQLVGPMQSWGVQSNFTWRETGLEPSKSGVIGLLRAAFGHPRNLPVDPKMIELGMGVRIDQQGSIKRDFHTAGKSGYRRADGSLEDKDLIVSNRDYLADAAFLVGLEHDDLQWLQTIQEHLQNPIWFLYLGRKAFVPALPVWVRDGLTRKPLIEALSEHQQWLGFGKRPETVPIFYDNDNGTIIRPDYPISYAERKRRFAQRRMTRITINFSEATS